MVVPELEQQLLQLSPDDKLYIIQLLAQSLTTHNNNTQPVQTSKIPEYPQPHFYGCIQDESFFRHPQGQQAERETITC